MPPPTAVQRPMSVTFHMTMSLWTSTPDVRTSRYTPAATMVAAWMSADTGVGPAMADGNHHHSGPCADLAHAAMTRHHAMVALPPGTDAMSTSARPASEPAPLGT